MNRVSRSASVAAALLALVAFAGTARADKVKCEKTIAKEGAKFLQADTKAQQKCFNTLVKNGGGICPDLKTIESISKAAGKLASAIAKQCGGDDKICGGDTTNETTPSEVRWPATCPNFERGPCANAIVDCGGIATCLTCIDELAVDQAMTLYYGSLNLQTANKDLNKCQQSIGKSTSSFLSSKSKALQKCWDAQLGGKLDCIGGMNAGGACSVDSECPGGVCPTCIPPSPGDGKYLGAIQKAETKKVNGICKACGGDSKDCDRPIDTGLIVSGGSIVPGTLGADDFTPAAIGFGSPCPPLTLPYAPGTQCNTLDDIDGAPDVVDSLRELILCADCVTQFKVDCADTSQVPESASYPAECNVCATGLPTGVCPTSLQVTGDGPKADLDSGWTGVAHDSIVPTNGRLTLTVSGCANANFPCGQCNVSGPLPNAGGTEFNNQRCTNDTSIQCIDDTPCIGGGGTCEFFFGAPLPLSSGNVPVCVTNQLVGSVSGTTNFDDGTSATTTRLLSRVHVTGTVARPCPVCIAGICESTTGSPRDGLPCTVNGSNVFGPVSFDCPPNPAALNGNLDIILQNATGTQTVTLAATNPNCRATGYTTNKCFCDTCNNANAEACSSNADCPISGGNPGICGGKRCISGSNNGAPCNAASECPGGGCGQPGGTPTAPNGCLPPDGCAPTANNEGECPDGPVDRFCSVSFYQGCIADADCQPPTCPLCLPTETCNVKLRECYPDNGVVGGSVSVTGVADPACAGTYSAPTLGSLFCIAPTGSSAVNQAGGLPGLGRLKLPAQAILNP